MRKHERSQCDGKRCWLYNCFHYLNHVYAFSSKTKYNNWSRKEILLYRKFFNYLLLAFMNCWLSENFLLSSYNKSPLKAATNPCWHTKLKWNFNRHCQQFTFHKLLTNFLSHSLGDTQTTTNFKNFTSIFFCYLLTFSYGNVLLHYFAISSFSSLPKKKSKILTHDDIIFMY